MAEKTHLALESEFEGRVWRGIALGGIIAFSGATIGGWYFADRITKPLSRLKKGIEELRDRNYSKPLIVQGDDEIAQLGRDFENLRSDLHTIEELRKDVISDLAHEIMTPLQSMLGVVDGIEEGIYNPSEKLDVLRYAIKQIQSMVDDMKNFSHTRARIRNLHLESVNLSEFLPTLLEPFSQQAKDKGLQFTLKVASDQEIIQSDRNALSHIVSNLVQNAINYTQSGGISIHATTQQIVIRDTGCGIHKKDLPYIFERFYRADKSRSRDTGGTGLGLAIVKEFVRQLNWDIKVTSSIRKGSSFFVLLKNEKH